LKRSQNILLLLHRFPLFLNLDYFVGIPVFQFAAFYLWYFSNFPVTKYFAIPTRKVPSAQFNVFCCILSLLFFNFSGQNFVREADGSRNSSKIPICDSGDFRLQ
jgi:hypothetical protein